MRVLERILKMDQVRDCERDGCISLFLGNSSQPGGHFRMWACSIENRSLKIYHWSSEELTGDVSADAGFGQRLRDFGDADGKLPQAIGEFLGRHGKTL